MKKIVFVTLMAIEAIGVSAQKWVGVPENRFAVTVKIDSAIASEPQKMYMYCQRTTKDVYVLDD